MSTRGYLIDKGSFRCHLGDVYVHFLTLSFYSTTVLLLLSLSPLIFLCRPLLLSTHAYFPSHLPSHLPILSFMALQGAAKIMDGARSALGKAKQAAGKILDAAEEVGSVSAMAKKALGGLLLELHGSEDIDME